MNNGNSRAFTTNTVTNGQHPSDILRDALIEAQSNLTWLHRRKFRPNEADTRRALIDPVLDGLGWPMRSMGHVFFEHQLNTKDKLDYVLSRKEVFNATDARQNGLVIEAKSARDPLKPCDFTQLASYMTQMAVPWGVLTNGRTWALLDASRHLELARDRVVWSIDLTDRTRVLKAKNEWRSISFADDAEQAIDDHERDFVTGGGHTTDVLPDEELNWTHYIKAPGGTRAVLHPNADGILARLRENSDDTFDILPGAFVMTNLSKSLRKSSSLRGVLAGRRLGRPELSADHPDLLRLSQPVRGLRPSAAVAIVLGRVANGHVEGRKLNTKNGRNDRDIRVRKR